MSVALFVLPLGSGGKLRAPEPPGQSQAWGEATPGKVSGQGEDVCGWLGAGVLLVMGEVSQLPWSRGCLAGAELALPDRSLNLTAHENHQSD